MFPLMKTYFINDNTCPDITVFRYKPVKIQPMKFQKIESKFVTLLTPNLSTVIQKKG